MKQPEFGSGRGPRRLLNPPLVGLLLPALLLSLLGYGGHCNGGVAPPDDEITDPLELINYVTNRLIDIQTGRFRVVAEYYGGDMRGANFRQVLLVRQPEDIHIQTLSPFGQTLQMLVSNGETMSLYDLEEEIYYTGSPSPQNLARLLPFYMTAGDMVRVLLGAPPFDQFGPDTSLYTVRWDREEGYYVLGVPLADGSGQLEMGIRHGDWTLSAAKRFDSAGELVFELRTGSFEEVENSTMPTQLRFLLEGDTPVDMSIDAESVELNIALPDELFVLEAPRGVEQRLLGP